MENVEKRPVIYPGFNNIYEVTEDARVWSPRSNRFLTKTIAGDCPPCVFFSNGGSGKPVYVSLLVATAFVPKPQTTENLVICYLDGDKYNDKASNLQWMTEKMRTTHYLNLSIPPTLPANEKWNPVCTKGYEDKYVVSTNAKVWGKLTKTFLKCNKRNAYPAIQLCNGVKRTFVYLHILVAEAFIPKPASSKRLIVNHKDGNSLNSHVSNLEWATYSRNTRHAIEIGSKKSLFPKIPPRPVTQTIKGIDKKFYYPSSAVAAKRCAYKNFIKKNTEENMIEEIVEEEIVEEEIVEEEIVEEEIVEDEIVEEEIVEEEIVEEEIVEEEIVEEEIVEEENVEEKYIIAENTEENITEENIERACITGDPTADGSYWEYKDKHLSEFYKAIEDDNPFDYKTMNYKPHPEDNEYLITSIGTVYSLKVNRWLAIISNDDGYMIIALTIKGQAKNYLVHRLVALVFLENPEKKECVNHINLDTSFNHVENLEWVTRSENTLHAHKLLDFSHKTPVSQYDLKGNFIASYESMTKAFIETGSSISGISANCKGKRKYTLTQDNKKCIWKYTNTKKEEEF